MRTLQILLAIGLLACLAYGASSGGYSSITIYGNDDPGACTLTLTMTVQASQLLFTETVNNPNWDCTYQNLQLAPFYREDPMGDNITLTQVGSTNTFTGSMNLTQLANANGLYCENYGSIGNSTDSYGCRVKYGQIFFQIALFVNNATGQFDTTWTDLFFPNYGTTKVNSSNGVNLLTPNNEFPQLVARLPNGYFSWSNTITDLLQPIYVIGTVQLSNQVNLTTYFADFRLNAITVKKPDHSYIVYQPPIVFYPFSAMKQGPNNATHIGLIWDQPLTSLNDCVGGCQVSFVLQNDSQVYLLQTTGITTQPARMLRA